MWCYSFLPITFVSVALGWFGDRVEFQVIPSGGTIADYREYMNWLLRHPPNAKGWEPGVKIVGKYKVTRGSLRSEPRHYPPKEAQQYSNLHVILAYLLGCWRKGIHYIY